MKLFAHGSLSQRVSSSATKRCKTERRTIMSKVIHFELPADDPQRAVEFYEKVFGWTITKWEGPNDYWLITA
ncbi:MAG: VOC family protein, partial [Halobacteriota archaeon]